MELFSIRIQRTFQLVSTLSYFLMGETLHKPDREKWRKDIMNLLGIDDTYYKSKYKEPVSDFPSDSNQIFAKEMQSIFR